MKSKKTELEERIARLSTIKAIGWTSLLIFGFITLVACYQIVGSFLITRSIPHMFEESESEFSEFLLVVNKIRAIYFMVGFITLLVSLGAVGLLTLKNWGRILFHATTIVLIITLVSGLAWYLYYLKFEATFNFNQHFENQQRFQTIGLGTIILLIAWILTRLNIVLGKKIYRLEFR